MKYYPSKQVYVHLNIMLVKVRLICLKYYLNNINCIFSQKAMEKMLVHLNLCEHAMKKSQAVSRMNVEEMLMYDNMSSEIDHNITNTKTEIDRSV